MDAHKLMTAAGLAPMQALTLTITPNCNLRCEHCWPACGTDTPWLGPLPGIAFPVLERVIRQFGEWGIEELCLTGGEPLTHPDWLALLQACCRQPGVQRVRLQTNATLLTTDIARCMSETDLEKLIVEVSLDGATAATHDAVRGAGSFDQTLKGLHALAHAGLGSQTVVAFTEMAHNFHELPQLLSCLIELKISRLVSGTLVQSGRAARSLVVAPPTPAQYQQLLHRYHHGRKFQADYRRVGTIACLEWLAGRFSSASETCRCAQMPYITANGTLYPCTLLSLDSYGVPGVFSRPLADVLRHAVSCWADLPQIYQERRNQLAPCRVCAGFSHCGGGCLGRACALDGNPMQVEDRCALRKVVYDWHAGNSSPIV